MLTSLCSLRLISIVIKELLPISIKLVYQVTNYFVVAALTCPILLHTDPMLVIPGGRFILSLVLNKPVLDIAVHGSQVTAMIRDLAAMFLHMY